MDLERRILAIYQQCRTPETIAAAFQKLQQEMEESIRNRLDSTRKVLMERFDEDVHARLKLQLCDAQVTLDRITRLFWMLTRFVLADSAAFDDSTHSFDLNRPPLSDLKVGRYHLISKKQQNTPGDFLYRLSHRLGEWVIDFGKNCPAPVASVSFDVSHYPAKMSVVEALKNQSGWLTLQRLAIDSLDREEHLLFSAFNENGVSLEQETCERLFHCNATVSASGDLVVPERLQREAVQHAKAAIAKSLEANSKLFGEQRERLDKWADDMAFAVEKELADTKAQIALDNFIIRDIWPSTFSALPLGQSASVAFLRGMRQTNVSVLP